MTRKFSILLIGLLFGFQLFFSSAIAGQEYPAREFRGVWIGTVANIDWPSRQGLPVSRQKEELLQILDKATALHLNAIILQVRPEADALYDSKLEPWSRYLTGVQGRAPEPYYDPLEFAIEECHKRCLELHAWLNPYRASLNAYESYAPNHVSKIHPDCVYIYGNFLWMDPGKSEVRQELLGVISDLVKRYDLDGIHFDDYFYPYAISGVPFPDKKTYGEYIANGGTLKLAEWRRENINSMVQAVRDTIKKQKPWVKFGISPFGIWQPGYPPGITGLNSTNELYADSRKWLQEGWVDYLTPQLYWKINNPRQSYPRLLDWWLKQNILNRNIYAGNNISNVGSTKKSWPVSEIINQIQVTRQQGAQGNILFSMKPLLNNTGGLADNLLQDCYERPAIVPTMTWLNGFPPEKPNNLSVTLRNSSHVLLKWDLAKDSTVWNWAIYKKTETGNWNLLTILPSSRTSYLDPNIRTNREKIHYAISALDRLANESPILESVLQD